MPREWRHLVDDLEPGDRIEIDCGDTMIAGKFLRLFRNESRRWMCELRMGSRVELAAMSEIKSMRRIAC